MGLVMVLPTRCDGVVVTALPPAEMASCSILLLIYWHLGASRHCLTIRNRTAHYAPGVSHICNCFSNSAHTLSCYVIGCDLMQCKVVVACALSPAT